jgi:primary-amine oxidase
MAVDSHKNTVSEIDVNTDPLGDSNPYGNCFNVKETVLETESDAQRLYDANKARCWKISNAEGKVNGRTGKPVAYKLFPFTSGPAQPPLLTDPSCAVSK